MCTQSIFFNHTPSFQFHIPQSLMKISILWVFLIFDSLGF